LPQPAASKGMEKCIQETVEYTREREIFGQSVLDNQVVHFCMAELQTEIEALRALIYDAVEGYIDGTDVTIKASMAKLKVGRLQREVTDAYLYIGVVMVLCGTTPLLAPTATLD
jgi:citronellyl-CoA dehydrogenase